MAKATVTGNLSWCIVNEPRLLDAVMIFMERYHGSKPFTDFVKNRIKAETPTPFGFNWKDKRIDAKCMDALFFDIAGADL